MKNAFYETKAMEKNCTTGLRVESTLKTSSFSTRISLHIKQISRNLGDIEKILFPL